MISIQTHVDLSQYTPRAARILSLLGPAAKTELHDAAATETVELLRKHIRAYAASHHKTADRIKGGPATRTGHLEKAADSVSKGDITADSATVNISSPGFRRALGPLTILPKNKPMLTIPMHAKSYGKTYGDMVDAGAKIFRIRKKDGRQFLAMLDGGSVVSRVIGAIRKAFGGKAEGATLIVLYALKTSSTLQHAPDMLPEEEEFQQAARKGVVGIIEMRLAKRGVA